jgi:hypothetical protein
MIIYKVPTRGDGDEHSGYSYHFSKREAKNKFKESGASTERGDEVEELELAMNKHDILRFLNLHCAHPDNG